MKLRLAPFRTRTRSQTLHQATSDAKLVAEIARKLLGRFELDAPVRLAGVGVSSLEREHEAPVDDSESELALPI